MMKTLVIALTLVLGTYAMAEEGGMPADHAAPAATETTTTTEKTVAHKDDKKAKKAAEMACKKEGVKKGAAFDECVKGKM